ncbi:MAG TPA: ATP-binding cassette domain-containing protein [Marinagarivorans sp.]
MPVSTTTTTNANAAPTLGVDLQGVKFKYRNSQQMTLNITEWQLASKESVFIYGPSGSGKSTLLGLLAGLLVPTSGSVKVLGQAISHFKGAQRDRFRSQHIGVIFQQFNLIPWLSVQDNIAAASYFSGAKGLSGEGLIQRVAELLQRLGLPLNFMGRKTDNLSIGQQQRVAIARALINKPDLIIADEPTSALDAQARDDFIKLLLECAAEYSSTLIFVSHDKTLAKHFNQVVDLQALNLAAKEGGHAA